MALAAVAISLPTRTLQSPIVPHSASGAMNASTAPSFPVVLLVLGKHLTTNLKLLGTPVEASRGRNWDTRTYGKD